MVCVCINTEDSIKQSQKQRVYNYLETDHFWLQMELKVSQCVTLN